ASGARAPASPAGGARPAFQAGAAAAGGGAKGAMAGLGNVAKSGAQAVGQKAAAGARSFGQRPANSANPQQPAWAKRLHRRQQIGHAATAAAHTLRGGDGGGLAQGPSLGDSDH
ncbi:P-type conjugative transfer protein TrbL, partial [Xanthomonas euvesicatoria]|nr:P-type conjugative transfer protein TrbL [Xanthomonas euvesicatoria]